MAIQAEIDYVRAMAGGTRTRNITDQRIGEIIDSNWDRIAEETGIAETDTSVVYYSVATQMVRRLATAEIWIGWPDMTDSRNSLLREVQNMIATIAKPDPSDPDSEIICDSDPYETYPLNADGTVWLSSVQGRPRYRTYFGSSEPAIL